MTAAGEAAGMDDNDSRRPCNAPPARTISINTKQSQQDGHSLQFEITGRAAHGRIAPLLLSFASKTSSHWIDATSNKKETISKIKRKIQFLWENAPRHETRSYRDDVKCYSHLPNGTAILDDKWALARLFSNNSRWEKMSAMSNTAISSPSSSPPPSTLESHCFRGKSGFQSFCNKVDMLCSSVSLDEDKQQYEENTSDRTCDEELKQYRFPDLLDDANDYCNLPPTPTNWWVIKDANSNGAGGVWVVGPENAQSFVSDDKSPLMEDHRYVAQRYAWPPVLYGGRKCHVRVYGLITSDGRAFVHKRAFLHVANEPFQNGKKEEGAQQQCDDDQAREGVFEPSVHITNCCANSHDDSKFAGEICADLQAREFGEVTQDTTTTVILSEFFPSICASVRALAERSLPFLRGGEANNGFEYLGMDFILSYDGDASNDGDDNNNVSPVAYLLEVNAPPSQDTATGLAHAEHLHNDVIRDILSLWVLPKVLDTTEQPGGWKCVYKDCTKRQEQQSDSSRMIVPSKAAILNKIRWAIYERKVAASDKKTTECNDVGASHGKRHNRSINLRKAKSLDAHTVAAFARSQFPYFDSHNVSVQSTCSAASSPSPADTHPPPQIFFENAGGSQVPYQVIQAVTASLAHRNRSVIGSGTKQVARRTLLSLLGGVPEEHFMFLGPNASALLEVLARQYVQLEVLKKDDDIIISTENHLANVNPWLAAASAVGARVKWWSSTNHGVDGLGQNAEQVSSSLGQLLTSRTRIVAVSHASNVLGQVRDLAQICMLVRRKTQGYAHVVADGVAAAPHVFPSVSELGVDWYGVSCHKMFGTHLGGLCGLKSIAGELNSASRGCSNEHTASENALFKLLEIGTVNYEACAGVQGLARYFSDLASFTVPANSADATSLKPDRQTSNQCTESQRDRDEDATCEGASSMKEECQTTRPVEMTALCGDRVKEAYRRIRLSELPLVTLLLNRLRKCDKVRIIESETLPSLARLPVVSFVHEEIAPSTLVRICSQHGIACRQCTFLCTDRLMAEFGFGPGAQRHSSTFECSKGDRCQEEGLVRISLAHYNTVNEVVYLMDKLQSTPGWL